MAFVSIDKGLKTILEHVRTRCVSTVASYERACKAVCKLYEENDCEMVDIFLNARIKETLELIPKKQKSVDRYIFRTLGMLEDIEYDRPISFRHATDCRFKYSLDTEHQLMVDDFANSLNMNESTVKAILPVARSFFHLLQEEGICKPCEMDIAVLHRFLTMEAPNRISSMGTVAYTLRKICRFLQGAGYTGIPDDPIPFTLPPRRSRVLPAFSADDIKAILSSPDRNTESGRRDFAVLMLASATGMRASDVGNLRLCDIDWRGSTVRFRQCKTTEPLSLPLMPGVAKAIADYVLTDRPQLQSDKVFITTTLPHRSMRGCSITNILYKHMRLSGVEKSPHDGKAFHAFRRNMGLWLLETGVPIDTISQVLGHRSKEVLTRYLPLATKEIKICALGFEGIEMTAGVYL